jgi:ribose transport system ATP-binding protein
MDDVLAATGIQKAFDGVPALRDARLRVRAGEVHGLIGQNGAGKSTLIKILSGALPADAGHVTLGGEAVRFADPMAAQAAGIATIHQEISLVPLRSVAENVFLGREPRRYGFWLDRAAIQRESAALLATFGLDIDVSRPLGAFNIATQQLVAIARAVGSRARIVIMDEPTSSLDDREVQTLAGVIRKLRADGVGVVLITHRLDELYAMCDRVTVMRDGCTVLEGELSSVGKLQLVATMLGRSADEVAHEGQTAFSRRPPATTPTLPQRGRGQPLLQAEHLAAGTRLRDVSLEVRRGEIVGLGGLLGSGRTETARALFGADKLSRGRMRIDGTAGWRTPREAIAAGIAFCPEDRKAEGIVPDLSVRENLTLALLPRLARLGIVDSGRQARLVDEFIARLGIKTTGPGQPIRELSGGNQQKVLLARWLCTAPRLLILDEPTRGIDVGAKAEIQRLVDGLAEEGLGVLMISSEMEELVEGCDRVGVLRDGVTVASLQGDALTQAELMRAMAHGHQAGPEAVHG